MLEAVKSVVEDGTHLREVARIFDVPVETLRRRVVGSVPVNCRPGPKLVLKEEEEEALKDFCVNMSEMGYGLRQDDMMRMAYQLS